jgi:hypothetical protein
MWDMPEADPLPRLSPRVRGADSGRTRIDAEATGRGSAARRWERVMSEMLTVAWKRRQEWINTRVADLRVAGAGYGGAIERAWADWRALDAGEQAGIQAVTSAAPPSEQG